MNDIFTYSVIFFLAALLFAAAFFVFKNTIQNEKLVNFIGLILGWIILFVGIVIFITGVYTLPITKFSRPTAHPTGAGCPIDSLLQEK